METNRYAQHKDTIRKISEEQGVDIGTACAMLRDQMGWHFDGPDTELTEFVRYIAGLSGEETRAYFYAE